MNIEKFTTRFQQALAESQSLALGKNHQFIEPVHLMLALLNQENRSSGADFNSGGIKRGVVAQWGQ